MESTDPEIRHSTTKRFLGVFERYQCCRESEPENQVKFEILLEDKQQSCGSAVTGWVRVTTPVHPVSIASLRIELVGIGEYKFKPPKRTVKFHEVLIKVNKELLRVSIIEPGVKDCYFVLDLPDELPPTHREVRDTIVANIDYYIKLLTNYKIEPGELMSKLFYTHLFVRGTQRIVKLRRINEWHERLVIRPHYNVEIAKNGDIVENGKSITITANLNKLFFKPGEEIPIYLRIENNTNIKIKSVFVDLLRQIGINKPEEFQPTVVKMYNVDSYRTGTIAKNSVSNINFKMCTKPWHVTINQCRLYAVWFRIVIWTHLPPPHKTNDCLSIPLEISDKYIKIVCLALAMGLASGARPRQRLQPIADEYDYEPQAQERAAGDQVVLVSQEDYDALYRAQDRQDEEYHPRPVARPAPAPRLKSTRLEEGPKQPPVQTIRNYNKVNDDGSFTFGYEAADGSFKEETRGTDCVVRGKYGYVDPDGNKREFTYVSGNPCDPNKPDEEEQEPAGPDSAERDDGVPNYPTRPAHRPTPTTTRPPTTFFQNDFRDADEDEVEEEPLQHIRQRVVQRPVARRPTYQAQPIAITPRPLPSTTARALPPATTFRPQLLQVTARPQLQYSPEPVAYSPTPAPAVLTSARPGQIDFAAEFAKFHRENQQLQSTSTATGATPTKTTLAASPSPSGNPLYSTELVYDPSSGSYNTQLYQTLPQTKGELNLNQRLQPYVAQPQHQQARPFIPSPQLPSVPASQSPNVPLFRHQIQHQSNPQEVYQRQQAEQQFQNSAQLFAQQQQIQQSQLQRDRAAARAQAQRLSLAQPGQAARPQPQYYFVAPRGGESGSTGQIDAFLRGHGIQF